MNRNEAFSHLRKESLDLFNRLKSIDEDIQFVIQVHDTYPDLPLLPNLRCGAWYTDPFLTAPHPVYFKSTDGHFNNWQFNLRRPNLHLLPIIAEHGGVVLVDSTRSGKRMPDAFSKTVPIWCAVVNRASLLRRGAVDVNWDASLHTPPGVVSSQEHSQIEHLLDGWAKTLYESSYSLPDFPRPLRPIWISPISTSFPRFSEERDFEPIICVSASRQVQEGSDRRSGGYVYIQGSGDDHELWGMGLTPELFWRNRERILSANRSEITDVVGSCVSHSHSRRDPHVPSAISRVNGRLLVCCTADLEAKISQSAELEDVAYVVISRREPLNTWDQKETAILRIATLEGKKGQTHFLKTVLPLSIEFISSQLAQGKRVAIACDDGKDLSVGVATAVLQKYFDDEGNYTASGPQNAPDKQSIRTRLEWIIADRPEANPSRNTLKRVNEFLLTSRSFLFNSP